MNIEVSKDHSIRNRVLDFARKALFTADGLLLTQPRTILYGFINEVPDYENGGYRYLGIKETLRNGILSGLPIILPPPVIGVVTYGITRSPEIAAAAVGATYVVEGAVLDFCECMAYSQGISEALTGKWTFPLQRKLAELADYPKSTSPFWLT